MKLAVALSNSHDQPGRRVSFLMASLGHSDDIDKLLQISRDDLESSTPRTVKSLTQRCSNAHITTYTVHQGLSYKPRLGSTQCRRGARTSKSSKSKPNPSLGSVDEQTKYEYLKYLWQHLRT
jgi:hypothetical protein